MHELASAIRLRLAQRQQRHQPLARLRVAHGEAEFLLGSKALQPQDLQQMGLSVVQAFEMAAENALRAAQHPAGLAIRVREARHLTGVPTEAMQVDTPGSLPSGWVAHPRLHEVLHQHFEAMLGAEPVFFAPADRVLLVAPAPCPLLEHWIAARFGRVRPLRLRHAMAA